MRAPDIIGIAILVSGATTACRQPSQSSDMFPLGGSWFASRHSGLPEAGARPTDLYRDVNGKRVLVQCDFGLYRYYAAQDCIVFEKPREDTYQALSAICGDRPAIAIEGDRPYRWRLDPDGLRATTGPTVDGGTVVTPTIPTMTSRSPLNTVTMSRRAGPSGRST